MLLSQWGAAQKTERAERHLRSQAGVMRAGWQGPTASSELLHGGDSAAPGVSRFTRLCWMKIKEVFFDSVLKVTWFMQEGHVEAGGMPGKGGCQYGAEGFR